jgi:hypothetical protein
MPFQKIVCKISNDNWFLQIFGIINWMTLKSLLIRPKGCGVFCTSDSLTQKTVPKALPSQFFFHKQLEL